MSRQAPLWLHRACQVAASTASIGATAGLCVSALLPAPAFGQVEEERIPSVLDLPREGYEPPIHRVGPFNLALTTDVRVEYDNNIFARNIDRTQDVVVNIHPALQAKVDTGRLVSVTEASASIYRFLDTTSQNHEGFAASTRLTVNGDRFNFGGRIGFQRSFQSRNDPEARRQFGSSPRLFNVATAELFAEVEGNRLGLRADASVDQFNFLSSIDDERDFTSYRVSLRARYRVSPKVRVFAVGNVNWRAFRLATDNNGVNRDSVSKSVMIGAEFDPASKLRGEIAFGVVNFDPKAALPGYTGTTARGSLAYRPRMRTAITLDLFRGDVATVRQGASGRIDTRARLGIQQEAFHNVLIGAGVGWRRTQFRGSQRQRHTTWAADGEVEYLLNRHISLAVGARYGKRTVSLSPLANAPGQFIYNGQLRSEDAFSRFQGGAELRFKF